MGIEHKRADWETRLTKHVDNMACVPFAWGVNDCTTFVVSCIQQMNMNPPEVPLYNYTTEEEAILFSKSHNLLDEMKKQLNAFEVEEGFQQVGDIIVGKNLQGFDCAHICLGRKSVACFPKYGVKIFPTKHLLEASEPKKILRYF